MADDEGGSSSGPLRRIKTVKFALGKGNKQDSKLIVVHKNELKDVGVDPLVSIRVKDKQKTPDFIRQVILSDEFLGDQAPQVLISVTGAAGNFPNMTDKLENIFCKGLVQAAKSSTAWIVSGGTDVGVMHFVGEANRRFETDVPTIGFATYNMINNKEVLKSPDTIVEYDTTVPTIPGKTVNLNPNHTHFVLVEAEKDGFGQEIETRSDFEEFICTEYHVSLCLIVVNGGPGTLQTVAEGVTRQFPVVVFEGTGRAADAIARRIRPLRKMPVDEKLEDIPLNPQAEAWMNQIIANEKFIRLYNSDSGSFELEILKAILSCSHGNFLNKLELAIQWNSTGLAEHILENDTSKPSDPEEFGLVLSKGLELSLDLEKPDLFRLLAEKGARKTQIDLGVLYSAEIEGSQMGLDPAIARYAPHLNTSTKNARKILDRARNVQVATQNTPLIETGSKSARNMALDALSHNDISFIKGIFKAIDPMFEDYAGTLPGKFRESNRNTPASPVLNQSEVSLQIIPHTKAEKVSLLKSHEKGGDDNPYRVRFTDAMLWAILMGKLELAKVIWEQTTLPVHAALVASGLCKSVARWLVNERQEFVDAADWFEEVADTLLGNLEYEDAKTLMVLRWAEFGDDALGLAVKAECKEFTANSHVQRYLDEKLYSNEKGGIPPGTSMWSVILCIFLPFLLPITRTFDPRVLTDNKKGGIHDKKMADGKWYHYYTLPYTKFWTNTLCYVGYLVLLAVVLVQNKDETPINISFAEYLLWVWMLAYGIEESSQWSVEGWNYFKYASNQMDVFIILLQVVYVCLSIAAATTEKLEVMEASTDFLIVTTIISYVRFLDIFSISPDLGPLYFVLQKIIGDVFKWLFVFILFAISFQVAFMALTSQVIVHNQLENISDSAVPPTIWEATIGGGSFAGSYFTIIGDWSSTMDVVKTSWFGSTVVSVYALIAQIMLVNLLIGMMGDTFNSVKENSDKEWKYSRYSLIQEYTSTSFHPPPFNILVIPIKKFVQRFLVAEEVEESVNMNPKQREQFKNVMKNLKDKYLEERSSEDEKTIGAVSDFAREQFKVLYDEQKAGFDSVAKKLAELRTPAAAAPAAAAAAGPSGGPALTAEVQKVVRSEVAFANELVKTEIAALQKSLLAAMKPEVVVHKHMIKIQDHDVPVTWHDNVPNDIAQRVLTEYKPFKEWVDTLNRPQNAPLLIIKDIHIQSVDLFGPRVGFVKFKTTAINENGEPIPGIVLMRGPAVGIMVILKLSAEGDADHGREFTILTIQPRVASGEARFAEIPAGMLDGGVFTGVAAKELKEETGIDIKEESLVDLTALAYGDHHKGMYPSAGGCDEYIRLFLYRTTVTRAELNAYQNKLTGAIDENEKISLKVIPLNHLYREAPDAKALSALLLYNVLMQRGQILTEY